MSVHCRKKQKCWIWWYQWKCDIQNNIQYKSRITSIFTWTLTFTIVIPLSLILWDMFYPCPCVRQSAIWFPLNNLSYPKTNRLKFIHKIMDHKRKAMFDFGLCHCFRSGAMPLFTLTENGGIRVHESVAFSFNIYLHYHYTFCKYKRKKNN